MAKIAWHTDELHCLTEAFATDLDPILNEVAVNAAWGTTINNLGARVSVHRCQTLLDRRWFGRRATG